MTTLELETTVEHSEYERTKLTITHNLINIEIEDGYEKTPNSRVNMTHADFRRIYDAILQYQVMAKEISMEIE